MKRLALVLAIICMATKVSAGILPGFEFGVKAGLNYQAHDFKTVVSNLNIKSSAGWFAGAVADIHWEKFGIKQGGTPKVKEKVSDRKPKTGKDNRKNG